MLSESCTSVLVYSHYREAASRGGWKRYVKEEGAPSISAHHGGTACYQTLHYHRYSSISAHQDDSIQIYFLNEENGLQPMYVSLRAMRIHIRVHSFLLSHIRAHCIAMGDE